LEEGVFAQAHENKEMDFTNKEIIKKIEKIEEQMIGKKDWQLQGEIQANQRPINSLLEEHLEFQRATKAAPEITQEVTIHLETMI